VRGTSNTTSVPVDAVGSIKLRTNLVVGTDKLLLVRAGSVDSCRDTAVLDTVNLEAPPTFTDHDPDVVDTLLLKYSANEPPEALKVNLSSSNLACRLLTPL